MTCRIVMLAIALSFLTSVNASAMRLPQWLGIDEIAAPFEAKAKAHEASAVFANFAGNGEKYVRYRTQRDLSRALKAFLSGPAPGGGSFVARVYRDEGSSLLYVTFDPAVQTSLTVRERVLFDQSGNAMRVHVELQSYNGYFRTVRDAYFVSGKPIMDTTKRYDYAPDDTTFSHPLKSRTATIDEDEMALPVYETRAELPFAA